MRMRNFWATAVCAPPFRYFASGSGVIDNHSLAEIEAELTLSKYNYAAENDSVSNRIWIDKIMLC